MPKKSKHSRPPKKIKEPRKRVSKATRDYLTGKKSAAKKINPVVLRTNDTLSTPAEQEEAARRVEREYFGV